MRSDLLAGKTVIVTGASRGLGLHIAEAFWSCGANLFVVARSSAALSTLCGRLAADAGNGQRVAHFTADLTDTDAPARIFEDLRVFSDRLDILVNNAGIVGPIGPIEENSWQSWTTTVQVNLIAPAALCRLAIRQMKAQGGGSIINISGGGAASPRPFFSAYGAAKAALVRLTETIAAEAGPYGIRANAIAPGAMNTEMHEAVLRAGRSLAGETEYRSALQQAETGGVSPATPAELAVFLASDAAGINGRLINAVWDPWKTLAGHAAELENSDVYTLRRILPSDRGLNWQ
jgi:3-oxoacyl-[acyl-carrier protein] reductase